MFLVVCEILLVLYLLSEVSQRKMFTHAAVFYTHVGVVLPLLRDVHQKWMTSDFCQVFISVAPSCWRVSSADQMLLVSG